MCRHITLVSKCLQLLALSILVSGKIITPSKEGSENNFKWQFSNMNSAQTTELEKLVRQSLENIFKNEELTSDNANGFGLKTPVGKESSLDLTGEGVDPNLDLSSPHILKVPVPQPYPVHIPVKQPFTVPIYKLVPEEIERKIPIPVQKLVPVYKEKPVKIIVEKHHPVPVYKPYPVPVPVNTHILLGKKEQPKWY